MPVALTLPDGYGYVVAVALGLIPFMSFFHGGLVGVKRKAAGVAYPNAYATAEQAKSNKAAHVFNCTQRAHLQFLENMPQTMASMLFAGAFYPQITTYLGLFWAVNRIVYAYGYIYSDKPNGSGRLAGSGFWVAQGWLWGMCVYVGLTKLV